MLSRIFGHTRVQVIKVCRKLHNKDLNDPHSSPRIVRVIKSRRMGSTCLRIGIGAGTCECGNEPSVSVKCGEFLDYLKTG